MSIAICMDSGWAVNGPSRMNYWPLRRPIWITPMAYELLNSQSCPIWIIPHAEYERNDCCGRDQISRRCSRWQRWRWRWKDLPTWLWIIFLPEVKKQLIDTWKTVGACDSIKMELTRDQEADLWFFFFIEKWVRHAVPLKKGSPQEAWMEQSGFNEIFKIWNFNIFYFVFPLS